MDGSAILEDVNLSIGKGETHVLMGNPAYEITSGNIYFNGALLIITHATKILESLHVDRTHVQLHKVKSEETGR